MDRKERLKIKRTPEKSFIYNDDTLILPTPNPKISKQRKEDTVLPYRIDSSKNCFKIFKSYIFYSYCIIPYVVMFYLIFFRSMSNTNVEQLTKEIEILKETNKKLLRRDTSEEINFAKVEYGTFVEVPKDNLYMYGFIGFRKFNDPNIILNESFNPGNCMSLKGSKGVFTINFKTIRMLHKVSIFHPATHFKSSCIKNFEIYGVINDKKLRIGSYTYDIAGDNYQNFKFKPVHVNKIIINILDNYGNNKYTSVYKIYAFGRHNKNK